MSGELENNGGIGMEQNRGASATKKGQEAILVTEVFTRQELVGRGAYGAVYKGINNHTKQVVAIKILNLDSEEDDVADIQKEIALLSQLKHCDSENIARYHGSFLNNTQLWIVMDYASGGSIRTLMRSGKIEEKYISLIAKEVLQALGYLHKAGIIHRDIKAANILLTGEGRVQLCDFGVAGQVTLTSLKRNSFVGTPYWMAPEVIKEGTLYDFKADIWSFGITMYEIATGNPPFADQEPMRAISLIPRSPPAQLEGPFSLVMKEFVAMCLNDEPSERPTSEELLKTKFIKSAGKHPIHILCDLIARHDRWKETTGHRSSLSDPFGTMTTPSDHDAESMHDEWEFDETVRPMHRKSKSFSIDTVHRVSVDNKHNRFTDAESGNENGKTEMENVQSSSVPLNGENFPHFGGAASQNMPNLFSPIHQKFSDTHPLLRLFDNKTSQNDAPGWEAGHVMMASFSAINPSYSSVEKSLAAPKPLIDEAQNVKNVAFDFPGPPSSPPPASPQPNESKSPEIHFPSENSINGMSTTSSTPGSSASDLLSPKKPNSKYTNNAVNGNSLEPSSSWRSNITASSHKLTPLQRTNNQAGPSSMLSPPISSGNPKPPAQLGRKLSDAYLSSPDGSTSSLMQGRSLVNRVPPRHPSMDAPDEAHGLGQQPWKLQQVLKSDNPAKPSHRSTSPANVDDSGLRTSGLAGPKPNQFRKSKSASTLRRTTTDDDYGVKASVAVKAQPQNQPDTPSLQAEAITRTNSALGSGLTQSPRQRSTSMTNAQRTGKPPLNLPIPKATPGEDYSSNLLLPPSPSPTNFLVPTTPPIIASPTRSTFQPQQGGPDMRHLRVDACRTADDLYQELMGTVEDLDLWLRVLDQGLSTIIKS